MTAALDHAALTSWIGAEHLGDQAVLATRAAFDEHPSRLAVLDHFLPDDVAERLSTFLRGEAEFRPEFGLYSAHDEAADETSWREAADDDRFFRYHRLTGTPAEYQLSPNAITYLQFRQAFQTEALKRFFEAISGLELGASDDFGAHSMTTGDYLRPHSDDNRDRRLALVLYLTPDWRPGDGGELHVVNGHGHDTAIEPRYNRIVVFDVLADTLHHVAPVIGDRARVSIGGWYRKPARD